MTKIATLLQKAHLFQKRAALEGAAAVIANTKSAIQSELAGGINALNKLVTTNNKAANSAGIQAIDDLFGRLSNSNYQLDPKRPDVAESTAQNMLTQIGQTSFYTSSGNAGTGYEPITNVGGVKSPAAYMNRIRTHLINMTTYLANNKPPATDNERTQNIS